ncbi:MAG TPA: hypothetical protein VFR24_07240 [Candidatus Angelobacter sp.]|nr:hypothetical protein [Candidatus Angelobacter sp.]
MDNKLELFKTVDLSLEDFSITELEDRLEFFPKCTINIQPA